VVSLPEGHSSHAVLRIASGFTSVQLIATDLGQQLVTASTVADAAAGPVLTPDGNVVIVTQPEQSATQPVLVLRLAQNVTWRLELDGGASTVRLDLGHGLFSGVDVSAGVSSLTMRLPAPHGTVPITIGGGASSVHVRLAGRPPVRATLGGGAGRVSLYGHATSGVAGGRRFQTPGWNRATDRLDLDCTAGVSSLEVRA
jgi:hypothetical protein